VLDILQLNKFGELDEAIEYDFVPLGELNETAQSQLKTDKITRAVSLVDSGLADPVAMMESLQKDSDLADELGNYTPDSGWLAPDLDEDEA
jgi:hypothetical protein